MAKLLIECGAYVNPMDQESFNHLSEVVRRSNHDMISLFVETESDVNCRDAWGSFGKT